MEVIHLILGKANPERMNGVNRVVNEMASNQVQFGYTVQVWGITANTVHDYPERNFTTVLFKAYKNPFRVDKDLKAALLAKRGSIVVHLHGAFIPRFFSVSKFLYQNGIPYIITPHSTYNKVMMKKNAFIKKIYFSLFERKLLDHASCVHLLGKTEWQGLEAIYNNKKSIMIPYGFTKPGPFTFQKKTLPFTVAYCGRIAIYPKGLDIMLEGFSLFHKKYSDSVMLVIGDGKEKSLMEGMAVQLGIMDAVVFTGSLYGEEKISQLKQSHVFAHPSRTDGLPATIVEAASLGLPCVVSEATNTGDYISSFHAGYTMPALSAQSFCDGLVDQYKQIILEDSGATLGNNAIKMISVVFNWEQVLEQFNGIYKNAMNGRSSMANELIRKTLIAVQ
jgi:glycosyltransferase involved in cell wall biosynthesis